MRIRRISSLRRGKILLTVQEVRLAKIFLALPTETVHSLGIFTKSLNESCEVTLSHFSPRTSLVYERPSWTKQKTPKGFFALNYIWLLHVLRDEGFYLVPKTFFRPATCSW